MGLTDCASNLMWELLCMIDKHTEKYPSRRGSPFTTSVVPSFCRNSPVSVLQIFSLMLCWAILRVCKGGNKKRKLILDCHRVESNWSVWTWSFDIPDARDKGISLVLFQRELMKCILIIRAPTLARPITAIISLMIRRAILRREIFSLLSLEEND